MLRKFLHVLRLGGFDYACYRVFVLSIKDVQDRTPCLEDGYTCAEILPAHLEANPFPELQGCDWYFGRDSFAFGVLDREGVVVCAQWMWFGERYAAASFWPIPAQEAAVSMHLVTAATHRGKGLATELKKYSAGKMKIRGFARLYSRIWWTNEASIRVSQKAGWVCVGTILEVTAPFISKPLRFMRRKDGFEPGELRAS